MKCHKDLFIKIGSRIKTARETANLTQNELADAIGKSSQYISDIERAVSGFSIPALIDICKALHTSSDYILMGITEESLISSPFGGLSLMSPEEQEVLIKGVRKLNEAIRYESDQK